MANNFGVTNPYTTKFPTGTLESVQLASPQNVRIAWPDVSGGNAQPKPTAQGFLNSLMRGLR